MDSPITIILAKIARFITLFRAKRTDLSQCESGFKTLSVHSEYFITKKLPKANSLPVYVSSIISLPYILSEFTSLSSTISQNKSGDVTQVKTEVVQYLSVNSFANRRSLIYTVCHNCSNKVSSCFAFSMRSLYAK